MSDKDEWLQLAKKNMAYVLEHYSESYYLMCWFLAGLDRHVCDGVYVDAFLIDIDPLTIPKISEEILDFDPNEVDTIGDPSKLLQKYLALIYKIDEILRNDARFRLPHFAGLTPLDREKMPNNFPSGFDAKSYFVIPLFEREFRDVPRPASRKYGRLFPVHHAIIPTRMPNTNVKMKVNRTHRLRALMEHEESGSEAIFGVVLDGFSPKLKKEPKRSSPIGRFSVDGVNLPEEEIYLEQVKEGVHSSRGASGLVFPELTVTDAALTVIKSQVSALNSAQREEDEPLLDWVFAGSWHYRDQHDPTNFVENCGEILDRFGKCIGRVSKINPYEAGSKWGLEALNTANSSREIQILISERSTIAFVICKDFCDYRFSQIFQNLAVDLVVVAAMGDERTLAAHGMVINQIRQIRRTKVFITQQNPLASGDDEFGFVFPPKPEAARELGKVAKFDAETNHLSRRGELRKV